MSWLSRIGFAVVLAGSCAASAGGGGDKKAATAWYPLAVGNTWKYRIGEGQFELRVAEVKVDGGAVRATIDLLVNKKKTSSEVLSVTKDEIARIEFEGKKAEPPIPILKLPPEDGKQWTLNSKVAGQEVTGQLKVAVPKELLDVRGKKYKVVAVTGSNMKANGVDMTVTWYFAEKVGMVKQVIDLAGQKVVIELEQFDAAK